MVVSYHKLFCGDRSGLIVALSEYEGVFYTDNGIFLVESTCE